MSAAEVVVESRPCPRARRGDVANRDALSAFWLRRSPEPEPPRFDRVSAALAPAPTASLLRGQHAFAFLDHLPRRSSSCFSSASIFGWCLAWIL